MQSNPVMKSVPVILQPVAFNPFFQQVKMKSLLITLLSEFIGLHQSSRVLKCVKDTKKENGWVIDFNFLTRKLTQNRFSDLQ